MTTPITNSPSAVTQAQSQLSAARDHLQALQHEMHVHCQTTFQQLADPLRSCGLAQNINEIVSNIMKRICVLQADLSGLSTAESKASMNAQARPFTPASGPASEARPVTRIVRPFTQANGHMMQALRVLRDLGLTLSRVNGLPIERISSEIDSIAQTIETIPPLLGDVFRPVKKFSPAQLQSSNNHPNSVPVFLENLRDDLGMPNVHTIPLSNVSRELQQPMPEFIPWPDYNDSSLQKYRDMISDTLKMWNQKPTPHRLTPQIRLFIGQLPRGLPLAYVGWLIDTLYGEQVVRSLHISQKDFQTKKSSDEIILNGKQAWSTIFIDESKQEDVLQALAGLRPNALICWVDFNGLWVARTKGSKEVSKMLQMRYWERNPVHDPNMPQGPVTVELAAQQGKRSEDAARVQPPAYSTFVSAARAMPAVPTAGIMPAVPVTGAVPAAPAARLEYVHYSNTLTFVTERGAEPVPPRALPRELCTQEEIEDAAARVLED